MISIHSPLRTRSAGRLRFIDVACAIIVKSGRFLVAQRGETMDRRFQWEFPGGKIHRDETPEEAIVREIREELSLTVTPVARLRPHLHRYPDISIRLFPIVCRVSKGKLEKVQHHAVLWIEHREIETLNWCEADKEIARAYMSEAGFISATAKARRHTRTSRTPEGRPRSQKESGHKRPLR